MSSGVLLAASLATTMMSAGSAAGPAASMPPIPARPLTWDLVPEEDVLNFAGFFFSRASATNITTNAALLNGQVTGRLFGTNGTTTSELDNTYVEQRFIGFFDYRPRVASGRASLKAAFEVDFTFGDTSNVAQQNAGGAFNGDVVNLQTKRLALEVDFGHGIQMALGLQAIADNARNPTRTLPDNLVHGGTKLAFWASDGAGLSFFGNWNQTYARLGWYTLYENRVSLGDDVHLLMADVEAPLMPGLQVGGHFWYMRDASRGLGTALGVGPGSRAARLNGASPLNLGPDQYIGNIFWAGVDVSFNRWLAGGPFSASGFLVLNGGTFDIREGSNRAPDAPAFDDTQADLFALMADLEMAYRWGRNNGDRLGVEMLYASGDDTPGDRTLSSVITGNNYGFPGALHASHRSLLLFPDYQVVNRQVAAVYDPSNLGYGVMALFAHAAADVWRDRLNVKVGMATANAAAEPVDGQRFIGIEGNVEVLYRVMPFMWIGAHAAMMRLGRFLEPGEITGSERVNVDNLPDGRPWTAFATLTWVPF